MYFHLVLFSYLLVGCTSLFEEDTQNLEALSNKIDQTLSQLREVHSLEESQVVCSSLKEREKQLLWENHLLRSQNQVLLQKLLSNVIKTELDETVSFSIPANQYGHPVDEEIVAMAEEILIEQVLTKTLCKCPHFEDPLHDCLALPEFTYFGAMCEPKLYIKKDSSTIDPICFFLPEENVQPVVRVLKFVDVLVDPSSGVILDRNKHSLFDSFMMKSLWNDIQLDVQGVIHVDKVASFVQIWGDRQYHYVNEYLSRIVFMLPILLHDPNIKILLHFPHAYVNMAIGLSSDRLLPYFFSGDRQPSARLPPSIWYHVKELYFVACSPLPGYSTYKELLQQLHAAYVPVNSPSNKILLVKELTPQRSVTNYEEMRISLEENFPKYEIVEYTGFQNWHWLVYTWNTAKIVIGPHGDALVNLIWCAPGSHVIELLHTEGDAYGHYYWIANAMDINYWMFPIKGATMFSNYTVPVNKIISTVTKILNNSS